MRHERQRMGMTEEQYNAWLKAKVERLRAIRKWAQQ
jgi:hypothetical protein